MRGYILGCVIGSATVSGLLCMDSVIYVIYMIWVPMFY